MTEPGSPPLATAVTSQHRIAPDHPAFAGHFPGQPILPGVSLLGLVLQAWRAAGEQLPPLPQPLVWTSAKFLSPVGPGDALQITLQADTRQLRFAVQRADQPVATGSVALGIQPGAA